MITRLAERPIRDADIEWFNNDSDDDYDDDEPPTVISHLSLPIQSAVDMLIRMFKTCNVKYLELEVSYLIILVSFKYVIKQMYQIYKYIYISSRYINRRENLMNDFHCSASA